MKSVMHRISAEASMRPSLHLGPHMKKYLYDRMDGQVWGRINDQVWFGVFDPIQRRAKTQVWWKIGENQQVSIA